MVRPQLSTHNYSAKKIVGCLTWSNKVLQGGLRRACRWAELFRPHTGGSSQHTHIQMSHSCPWDTHSLWKQFPNPPNGAEISAITQWDFKEGILFASLKCHIIAVHSPQETAFSKHMACFYRSGWTISVSFRESRKENITWFMMHMVCDSV